MVRTVIHGARIVGRRCPNGVQHTGIKFPSYCGMAGADPEGVVMGGGGTHTGGGGQCDVGSISSTC